MKRADFHILCLIALVFTIAGCGIDWFPEVRRAPTTPNPFSFTSRFGVPIQGQISSNSVVITGFANSTTASPISISTGSKYSINGSTPTATASTIKNNDRVKVIQTSAPNPGVSAVSTLTIGGVPGTFTTVTQTIVTPVFQRADPQRFLGSTELFAPITANDLIGSHTVSVSSSDSVRFGINDSNGGIVIPLTNSTSPVIVLALNTHRILLVIPDNASGTTTLTVDSTNFVITNTTPFTVTSSPK